MQCAGRLKALLGALLCVLHLLNLTGGWLEIPDCLPIIGNLDEVAATVVLLRCLGRLGVAGWRAYTSVLAQSRSLANGALYANPTPQVRAMISRLRAHMSLLYSILRCAQAKGFSFGWCVRWFMSGSQFV